MKPCSTAPLNKTHKYLQLMKSRYEQDRRAKKDTWRSEVVQVTGRHRKSLIRRLQPNWVALAFQQYCRD